MANGKTPVKAATPSKAYQQATRTNPASLRAGVRGSTASKAAAATRSAAAAQGTNLSAAQMRAITQQGLQQNWSSAQTQQAIGRTVKGGGGGKAVPRKMPGGVMGPAKKPAPGTPAQKAFKTGKAGK